MSEAAIQRQILDWLKAKGIFHWRQNTGVGRGFTRYGINGCSDILGILKMDPKYAPIGRFFAIEVKAPKGKPSKDQEKFLADVKRAGGIAIVARSLEDVTNVLG